MVLDVKFVKIGNSISVRIPKIVLDSLHISSGTEAELIVDNQQMVLRLKSKQDRLKDLLKKITPQNLHSEFNFGVEQGAEKWES
jgi:antitoxin MazE